MYESCKRVKRCPKLSAPHWLPFVLSLSWCCIRCLCMPTLLLAPYRWRRHFLDYWSKQACPAGTSGNIPEACSCVMWTLSVWPRSVARMALRQAQKSSALLGWKAVELKVWICLELQLWKSAQQLHLLKAKKESINNKPKWHEMRLMSGPQHWPRSQDLSRNGSRDPGNELTLVPFDNSLYLLNTKTEQDYRLQRATAFTE